MYGPTDSVASAGNGAVEYYLNPIYIRSLNLGAREFGAGVSSMELTQLDQMSVTAIFHANKSVDGGTTRYMRTPLCQGMGFVSAEYEGMVAVIESSIGIAGIEG